MHSNLKRDYFWNTVGVFAQNAISPFLLIVITRVNGIQDSGIFSFAFAVALVFWAFGMWGGRTYQVSDIRQEFSHRSYIMVRLILAIAMLIAAASFAYFNHYSLMKSSVIIALVLFKALESIADVLFGVLQVHDRLYLTGKSLLYKAIGGFGAFVVIDLLTKNIFLGSLGVVIVNVLLVLFYDIRIARSLENIHIPLARSIPYSQEAFAIIKRCAPVSAVLFLSLFSLNIPRYFVDLYHQEQIGYFGIIAMPITLLSLLMTFILQPKVVSLAQLYENRDHLAFNRIVRALVLITLSAGFVILLLAYLIGVPALNLVFGINFSSYKEPLLIIIAGGIINALVSIFMNILTIMRRFKHQFYILLLTNIALVILSALLIKAHGLLGGVMLFMIINFVQVIFMIWVYRTVLHRAMSANI